MLHKWLIVKTKGNSHNKNGWMNGKVKIEKNIKEIENENENEFSVISKHKCDKTTFYLQARRIIGAVSI